MKKNTMTLCNRCFGRGVMRLRARNLHPWAERYAPCQCGREPDSHGAAVLAEQRRLRERYEALRRGEAW